MTSNAASPLVVWTVRLIAVAFLVSTWLIGSLIDSPIRGQIPNPILSAVVTAIGGIVSAGTFFLKRWGIGLLSLFCAYYAVVMCVGSLRSVPFPFLMINLAIVAFFLIPGVVTILAWRSLRW